MKKRKICVVTGTRAEYGLLKWVMGGIERSSKLKLQIIVTGAHLSPEFGLTYQEIEQDGFRIDKKIEMLVSADTPSAIVKSMGLGMVGFADSLYDLKPDLMLVLGDRYEVLSAVCSAMVSRIPVAHLHGGESTEGVIDELIRHSITKMSHLHFVATDEYKNRVIQLGEQPNRVFQVGALGVDNIKRVKLLKRKVLEDSLNFKFGRKNLMITFHPVTLEYNSSEEQMTELLSALTELKDTNLIFTMPNADTNGRILFSLIKRFVTVHSCSVMFTSLGQSLYFSCMQFVDGVVGNSSSGLIEAPSFNIGTVNIGDRQRARIKADSVIDCEPYKQSILNAIHKLYSSDFQKKLSSVINPYAGKGGSKSVVKLLEESDLDGILKKKFYDLPTSDLAW